MDMQDKLGEDDLLRMVGWIRKYYNLQKKKHIPAI